MRATHQVAGTLKEGQPCMRVTQCLEDLRGRAPLAHGISTQVDEVKAPGALGKARGLKEGRWARNGSQAGQPGHLGQAQLQNSVKQEAGEAAGTEPPNCDCANSCRGRRLVFAQLAQGRNGASAGISEADRGQGGDNRWGIVEGRPVLSRRHCRQRSRKPAPLRL